MARMLLLPAIVGALVGVGIGLTGLSGSWSGVIIGFVAAGAVGGWLAHDILREASAARRG